MVIIKKLTEIIKKGEEKLEEDTQEKVRERWISLFDYIIIIGLSLLCAIVFNQSNPNGIPLIPPHLFDDALPKITAEDAMKKLESGEALFLDARPSNFFGKDHIKGAKNLPLVIFDIMYLMELGDVEKDKEIIINGRSFSTRYDDEVARKLMLLGHKNVKILDGGLSKWKKKGYPVES
jgi:rhodanese-related sulfurtransferase